MKLSELSYREYLAIEFLPAFVRHSAALGQTEAEIAENTARYAFVYADAFLRVVGREDHRLATAYMNEKRANEQVSLLLNMNGDFAPRVALLEIWETLGVTHQTAAMEKLRGIVS